MRAFLIRAGIVLGTGLILSGIGFAAVMAVLWAVYG